MLLGYLFPYSSSNSAGIVESSESNPAEQALKLLKSDSEAQKRLSKMNVRISTLTGTLNIFNSTKEDLLFFAKILNNEEYTYDSFLRLSSFYF